MLSWPEMIAYHAARRPQSLALIDEVESVTYEALWERTRRRASWLRECGVAPRDRVVFLGLNSIAMAEGLLATEYIGAIFVPVNHRATASDIGYMVDHCEAALVLTDAELVDVAEGAAAAAGSKAKVLALPAACALEDLPLAPANLAGPDEVARLFYTSGTTNRPKGVEITARNVYTKCVSQAREFGLRYDDVSLLVGPLFHVAGLDVVVTNAAYVGACVRMLTKFEASATLDALSVGEVTNTWMSPVMTRRVLALARKLEWVAPPGLRLLIGGGESTPVDMVERIQAVFPGTWYANAYGLTETGTGDVFLPAEQLRVRPTSVGLPVAEADLVILAPGGELCPAGVTGQVAIGGEKVSPGYWRDAEATAASFQDGRFLTGDLGYVDESGFVFIVGRIKDIIISGSENISAPELEDVLSRHPDVREIAIVGRRDEEWGEVPVAFVVLEPDAAVDVKSLHAYALAHLGKLKSPKAYTFLDEMPSTSIGKTQKGALQKRLVENPTVAIPAHAEISDATGQGVVRT